MKQKLFTLFLALVASVGIIYASDTRVDGIWYDFDDSNKTATVTYRGSSFSGYDNEYSGSVVIPPSVTYNGVTYSVTSIRSSAFRDCSSLTSVTIGNSVTSIGNYTFGGCSSLTSVTIPNSVKSIGKNAFYGCSSLTSITIPNSVTSIGEWAFSDCSSLTSVTIPNSVTSIGKYAFFVCSSLASITIPNSVTSIGEWAFGYCSSLTSVTISDSVTSIGDNAFQYCSSLASVTIPNSVTSIGGSAFYGCDKLVDVYCYATTPPATEGEYTFSRYDAYLYIPCESKNAYMEDAVWGNFKYIECISSEGIEDVQSDEVQSTKVVKDGQVLILRNGKTYTMQGVEVK